MSQLGLKLSQSLCKSGSWTFQSFANQQKTQLLFLVRNFSRQSQSSKKGISVLNVSGLQRNFSSSAKYFQNVSKPQPPERLALNTKKSKSTTLYYLGALGVLVVGASYCAVPLYRIFCQSYSYGGTVGTHDTTKDLSKMTKSKDREITIKFNADRSSSFQWNFRPQQAEIIVHPGETALAFYRAENKTDKPVDGISTYNVIPFEAGAYFNKIQCFCFEEQRLDPGETVELPVFFYIDPEFMDDPRMENINQITLSYTFFESKEMPNLKIPWGLHGKQ